MTVPAIVRNGWRHALAVVIIILAIILLRTNPNVAYSFGAGILLGAALIHLESVLLKFLALWLLGPVWGWRAFGIFQSAIMVLCVAVLWIHNPIMVTNGYMWALVSIVIIALVEVFYVSDELKRLKRGTHGSEPRNGDDQGVSHCPDAS